MDKYCEHCYLRDAKPCMECSVCNPGHRNFRPAPTPPITNADRIRSMSDEELAEAIMCPNEFNVHGQPLKCKSISGKDCVKCCLDWLRQPVEE